MTATQIAQEPTRWEGVQASAMDAVLDTECRLEGRRSRYEGRDVRQAVTVMADPLVDDLAAPGELRLLSQLVEAFEALSARIADVSARLGELEQLEAQRRSGGSERPMSSAPRVHWSAPC